MQNNLKKILALVLCLVMALTLLPTAVAEGDFAPDDKTEPQKQYEASDDADRAGITNEKEFSVTDRGEVEPDPDKAALPRTSERDVVSDEALRMGVNWTNIADAGSTVYRPFTAPYNGYYLIYSVVLYQNELDDTYGYLTDSSLNVTASDDDSGYGRCFWFYKEMSAGDVIYVGTRFYNDSATGYISFMIDYPWESDSALYTGSNTFNVPDGFPGSIEYRPFTPTASGTHKFYSTGSSDTVGVLMNSEGKAILYNDDSDSSGNFYFEYNLDAGVTYWLGVRFWSVSPTGNITVQIESPGLPESDFDGTIEWNPNDVQFKGTTPYVIYNGSAYTPRFTVKDAGGNVVDPSNYTYEYVGNVKAGTGYVVVTFTNLYSGATYKGFKIYLPATTATTVENVQDGIRVSWEPVTGAAGYVIYRRAWSSTTGGWTSFARWDNTTETTYLDGHDDAHPVYANTRYQYGVKAYFARRRDPITNAWIGGNVNNDSGNYNLGMVGPLKNTVRITTRKLTKLEAGSRKFTAYWTGSKIVTGYQLKYSTQENFSSGVKSAWITDPGTTSKVIKSLQDGTTYYVAVRSYKNFEGKKYYGEWSNVLAIVPGSGQTVTPSLTSYRAICAGENDYSSAGASTLDGCVNDMKAMAGMLTGVKNKFSVTKLPDKTSSQIISGIRTLAGKTSDNDVSVFSFSGHGSTSGIYCIDGETITFSKLATELGKVKGRVIVFLDCCQSGAAIGKGEGDNPEAINRAAIEAFSGYDLKTGERTRSGELSDSKFVVITAARSTQYSYDSGPIPPYSSFDGGDYAQGAFTAALIMAMGCTYPNGAYSGSTPADKNNDGKVTLKELYDTLCSYVNSWDVPQDAQYYGADSTVLFKR